MSAPGARNWKALVGIPGVETERGLSVIAAASDSTALVLPAPVSPNCSEPGAGRVGGILFSWASQAPAIGTDSQGGEEGIPT